MKNNTQRTYTRAGSASLLKMLGTPMVFLPLGGVGWEKEEKGSLEALKLLVETRHGCWGILIRSGAPPMGDILLHRVLCAFKFVFFGSLFLYLFFFGGFYDSVPSIRKNIYWCGEARVG